MSNEQARMKFYCDESRCIECFGCSVACAEAHELPVGISRRKVVTLYEGIEGKEFSTSIACMHCADSPCQKVCPVDCFYVREDGIVLHDKNKCIGCGYCLYACPFGAPQFPRDGAFGTKGAMDKCTMCAGGPGGNKQCEREATLWPEPYRGGKSSYLCRCMCNQCTFSRRC